VNITEWIQFISWRDVLDVALVSVVIYNLLLLIRGTRAVQMLLGLLFIGAAYYLAGAADLLTLQQLLGSFLFVLPFAIIVLFQQEIRRALASFGRNPLWGLGTHQKTEATIHETVLAATAMAERRTGALIVIQRLEGLRNYIENGIAIDALVSYDLLINIFNPETPLHDGAVIIQEDRIAAAACFLALGISEEVDALAVVVSEETGTISVAIDGRMIRDLDAKSLRNSLYQYLITDLSAQPEKQV
jgi:uncharacterized protein (TIGR00159 family)